MAKTNWQDPRTGEIISPHISGLQEAVGKLEESIGIETISEISIPLSEVFISSDDRYRIYQAPEGKRNWLLSPAPIIRKNGVIITNDFDIDYGGGAVVFTNPITESDVLTADFTHTIKTENILTKQDYASKSEAEVGADNTKVMTPLRVREFFIANGGGSGGVTNVVFQSGKKYYKFTATDTVNNFEIPSELFNPANDVIELIHGGNIPLIKDENYTLVGNLVTFIGYSLDVGDGIHCLITNTSYSYDALSGKPDLSHIVRYSDSELGTPISVNANTLGGQLPSYYAKSEDLSNTNIKAGVLEANIEQKVDKTELLTKENKQWKSDDWKTEADLITSFPTYSTTYFYTNVAWSKFPLYSIVKTTRSGSSFRGKQEVFTYDGIPLIFRLTKSYVSEWGAWQKVATTDKIDFLCTAYTGYTILEDKSYQQNGDYYIHVRFKKTDGTAFTANSQFIPFMLPIQPNTYSPLSFAGLNSSISPTGVGCATSFSDKRIYAVCSTNDTTVGIIKGMVNV